MPKTAKKNDIKTNTITNNVQSPLSFKQKMQKLAETAREDNYLTEEIIQEMRSWICEDTQFFRDIMTASEKAAGIDGRSGIWIRFDLSFSGQWKYQLSGKEYGEKIIENNVNPISLYPVIDNLKRSKRTRAYVCKLLSDLFGINVKSYPDGHFHIKWEDE